MCSDMLDEIEFRPTPFYYEATLSDGTVIHVMADGKAVDLNGNTYTAVFEEDFDGEIEDVVCWVRNKKE